MEGLILRTRLGYIESGGSPRVVSSSVLSVRPYEDTDHQAWDRFVATTGGSHPAQRRAWLATWAASYGVTPYDFVATEGAEVRGVLALFAKRRLGRSPVLFSAPGGVLARDEEAARALLAAARTRLDRFAWVELRDQRVRWLDLPTATEHCTHELALTADPEGLWRGFDAKLRNQIRKAQRGGFTVHWGAEHLEAFCRVMLENMRDLGTPMRAEPFFRRVRATLGDDAAVLVIARDGEPAGAMFLAFHRGIAMDLWASSLRRHFAHCPNQLLYWEALQEAIRRGATTFDFGRSQWDTGTFRFKQQWGAQAVPLYYQYLVAESAALPTFAEQRERLSLATTVWKRLPLPLARVLGEPIRRRFPELL